MLLAVDVGNTNITLGVFDDGKIVGNFRITTKLARTSDEYGTTIKNILKANGIKRAKIENAIVSSVVPAAMHSLCSGLIKYFDVKPIIVTADLKTGIKLSSYNKDMIGADRIVDAAAAYKLYGGPVLVLDFGTATTYDLISADGNFDAGVTAPGIRISAKALWEDAAKLPEVEIAKPDSILAKNTITSMQAGLVYGQIGATEYIIDNMIDESGYDDVKVVATGGLGGMISDATDKIDIYDPNLTLEGMRYIFEMQ